MRLRLLTCVAMLWMATPASADPFSINLLRSTHTVQLSGSEWDGTPLLRTTTDTAPVSDQYFVTNTVREGFDFTEGGAVVADLFEVAMQTSTFGRSIGSDSLSSISAFATTTLTFAPVVSGTALIEMAFLTDSTWTESMVRLTDLTTSTELWALGWEPLFYGWSEGQHLVNTPITIATALDISHVYQLTIFGHTNANGDGQTLTTSVNGLQAVPEPSTLLLLLIGAGASAIKRRRRRP
jgi:hypothetical protein